MIRYTITCSGCGVTVSGSPWDGWMKAGMCRVCFEAAGERLVHLKRSLATTPRMTTLRRVHCVICGTEYFRQAGRSDSGVCGQACMSRSEIPLDMVCNLQCMFCGRGYTLPYEQWNRDRFQKYHFCSDECRNDYGDKPPKICIYCSTLYHTPVYGDYCSRECRRRHRMVMGHIHSSDD